MCVCELWQEQNLAFTLDGGDELIKQHRNDNVHKNKPCKQPSGGQGSVRDGEGVKAGR